MKRLLTALTVLLAIAALLLRSAQAMESARRGLDLCAGVIVPSLLPFMAAANLASETGLTRELGKLAEPLTRRLFRVSGAGASAFALGVTGGYPLGASVVADMARRGEISPEEGGRLLMFCNNSGPAFIVGAAGVGAFGSAETGLLLYLCHILAAVTVGLVFRGGGEAGAPLRPAKALGLAEALPAAVKSSVASTLSVCGFVVLFSVVTGVLDALGLFTALTGSAAVLSGLGLRASRALLTGLLELGGGVGALSGLPPSPASLALAAFILGWGGLSVHCQTAAVCAGSGIKTARHTLGRLLMGIFSAVYALLLTLPWR